MRQKKKKYKLSEEKCYWIRTTSTNIRKRIEIIREIIHNAVDANARNINIICDYNEKDGLIIRFDYEGIPFSSESEILNGLMNIGYSVKEKSSEKYIGGMGIGLKGVLDCKLLTVVSINENNEIKVIIENPLEQIKRVEKNFKKFVEYDSENKKKLNAKNRIKIEIVGLDHQNLVDFSSSKLKHYIEYFTILGSSKIVKEVEVRLKGLKIYSNNEEGLLRNIVTDENEYVIKSGAIINKFEEIKKNSQFNSEYQLFSSNGDGFDDYEGEYEEIRELCRIQKENKSEVIEFLVFTTINKEIKKILNPNLHIKGVGRELDCEFFGFYMSKNYIVLPEIISFKSLREGGNASVQYLGFFNYDSLVLKSDRNQQGGDKYGEKVAENIKKIAEIISKIKVSKKKQNGNKEEEKKELLIIKEEIITEIRNAKFCIWVAMAWFTDNDIYEALKVKLNEGIHIRLIVSDEDSNKLDYEIFDTEKISKFGVHEKNRMHCKFAIFDFKVALQGSYNWTINAQNNMESISRITNKREIEKLAKFFNKIVLENKKNEQIKFI